MCRYRGSVLILALPAITIIIALVGASPSANASITLAGTPATIDVDLPSESTGVPDGILAVRVVAPASPADARYPDGAPVVVYAVGGVSAGTLRTQQLNLADDVIRIFFLYPGGTDLGRSSDGTYDYRGPNSIAALRDVIRYAAGELTDSLGRTIDDVVPVPVLHDNIGLVGASNGGNIVIAVTAEYGAELAGYLQYIIQWESPVSSQIATAELGPVTLDCQSSAPEHLFTANPRYLSYGAPEVDVDYSQLTYAPGSTRHPLFWDGNGDGRYTTVVDPNTNCRTPDLDLSGTLELDEDYPLRMDGSKQSYSRPATQAMADLRLFGSSWPADIPTPAEASAFWDLREAARLYPDALTSIPKLEGMVLVSVVDHYQPPSGKPHIRQAFEGWDGAGHWVKINPARGYVLEVDPSLDIRTNLPDSAPNTAPADWTDAGSYAYPDDLDFVYFAAAIHEMADRAHAAASATPTPTSTPTPSPTPTSTRTPTPTSSPTTTPAPTDAASPPASQCVRDVNSNGIGDIVDIQATAAQLPCHLHLPLVAANWRQPWPAYTALVITIGDVDPEAPIKPLLGVNAGPVPVEGTENPDVTAGYQQIGVTAVRTHDYMGPLDMATMYPDQHADPSDPASYDFQRSDEIFAAILAGGFEPYLRLGDSSVTVPGYPEAVPRAPINPDNWVRAAVEVVRHYRELAQQEGAALRYVEIWNEPNLARFWDGTRQEFFNLFAETVRALKAEFPELLVGGPSLGSGGFMNPQGREWTQQFLDYMQAQSVPLGFFSWHLYSNDPTDYVSAAQFYRDQLDSRGFTAAESHINEYNTRVVGVSQAEEEALRLGGRGAALVTAAWIGLQEQGVDEAFFYRGTDWRLENPVYHGLFLADGRPKRSALAVSLWSEMSDHPERLSLEATPAGGSGDVGVWTIAGQNAESEIALLIANPTATAISWRLAFADGRDPAEYTVAVEEVSDASGDVQMFIPDGAEVEIGAYSVQLVRSRKL